MLPRVAPDLSELVVCAEQAEQENILGASRGALERLAVWRCQHPVLLMDIARRLAARTGPARRRPFLYGSYPRTVSHDGTSVSWSPTQYPKLWRPNIDTLFLARVLIGLEVIWTLAAAVYTLRKKRAKQATRSETRHSATSQPTAGSG